jgi:LSD1 subclass zinc finger protein
MERRPSRFRRRGGWRADDRIIRRVCRTILVSHLVPGARHQRCAHNSVWAEVLGRWEDSVLCFQ